MAFTCNPKVMEICQSDHTNKSAVLEFYLDTCTTCSFNHVIDKIITECTSVSKDHDSIKIQLFTESHRNLATNVMNYLKSYKNTFKIVEINLYP